MVESTDQANNEQGSPVNEASPAVGINPEEEDKNDE